VREELELAYAVGDHKTARAIAKRLLHGAAAERQSGGADELTERARQVLNETEPDPFLAVVGALGLGVMAWLVYNYVL
jgi:hypothetical protein